MKKTSKSTLAVLAGAALLSIGCSSLVADDTSWHKSKYGEGDTLGAINNLSPEKVLQAAKLITEGKTYALGVVTGTKTPAFDPRRYEVTIHPMDPSPGPGKNEMVAGNDDVVNTWMGVGSQIDGLGHVNINGVYYNGLRDEDVFSPTGLKKLNIDALPPIVTRGVMIDIAKHLGTDIIDGEMRFNSKEIKAAAKEQGVTIEKGDVVLLHTGWINHIDNPDKFLGRVNGMPGLGHEGAKYLASLDVVAVGTDTWAIDALPKEGPILFPVHPELLVKNGIYMLENMDTRELAADGVHEFLFVLGQPRYEGAVQAIINPIAIR